MFVMDVLIHSGDCRRTSPLAGFPYMQSDPKDITVLLHVEMILLYQFSMESHKTARPTVSLE